MSNSDNHLEVATSSKKKQALTSLIDVDAIAHLPENQKNELISKALEGALDIQNDIQAREVKSTAAERDLNSLVQTVDYLERSTERTSVKLNQRLETGSGELKIEAKVGKGIMRKLFGK